jgi:Metallo-peptidase family M12B Reprolysin-like
MTSIRGTADSCLGVTSDTISVREDVFGYPWGPMDRTLSVKNHLNLIKDDAFNLSAILVAHDADFAGAFTNADTIRMQLAIDLMRELYAQVGVGVRKIYWQYIPTDQANGYSVVDGSEATQLTEDWSGNNDGIDLFFVTTITDAGGWSKTNGSCDKDVAGRTGAVVELSNNNAFWGILIAHEVGHYLGLSHANVITNVMGHDSDGNGIGSIGETSRDLTNTQGNTMKGHCSIRPSC